MNELDLLYVDENGQLHDKREEDYFIALKAETIARKVRFEILKQLSEQIDKEILGHK